MNPVCLIIGAGAGIGQALATAFAREGYDIALTARNGARLEELRQEVEKLGTRVEGYTADAGDESGLRAAIHRVREDLGHPEILIYNAAAAQVAKPLALSTAQLVDEFRVNVAGALVAVQEVAEAMKENGRGSILLTGGGFAYEPAANYASLSLGKAALRSLTYSLAQELGASGIHVATVTVYGYVQHGTHFDPARIAEAFVQLHRQPPGAFQIEYIYK